MPSPWSPLDSVQVRVGNPGATTEWCNATVDAVPGPGCYMCTITDTLPTLADCGKTHPHVPSTTQIDAKIFVIEAANKITAADDQIRDPI